MPRRRGGLRLHSSLGLPSASARGCICMNLTACRSALAVLYRRGVASCRSFPSNNLGLVNRPRVLSHLATAKRPRSVEIDSRPSRHPRMDNGFGNFDLLTKFEVDSSHTVVSKWRSRKTGLSIVHLDYEGSSALHILSSRANTDVTDSTNCERILYCQNRE